MAPERVKFLIKFSAQATTQLQGKSDLVQWSIKFLIKFSAQVTTQLQGKSDLVQWSIVEAKS